MKRSYRLILILVLLFLTLGVMIIEGIPPTALLAFGERFQTFVTIFLGIFTEAVPFLLAGSLVSGFIEVFVNPQTLSRLIPRQPVLAALSGALLGILFPVCDCGVIPITRRLQQKGMPASAGIAFLLAAPVVNPIVIASTYTAFGWGPVLLGRLGFTLLVAFGVGLLFHFAKPEEVLLPEPVNESADLRVHSGRPTDWSDPAHRGDSVHRRRRFSGHGALPDCRLDAGGCDANADTSISFARHRQRAIDFGVCSDGAGVCPFGLLDGRCLPGPDLCQHLHQRSYLGLFGLWADGGH